MHLLPDESIFLMWLIFIVSLMILHNFVFKPTLKILAEREKRTKGLDKDANYFKEQSIQKLEEYNRLMADAVKLGRDMREKILKEAAQEKNELITKARVEAEKHVTILRAEIAGEATAANNTLAGQTEKLAQDISNK